MSSYYKTCEHFQGEMSLIENHVGAMPLDETSR